jgi:alkylhydroperoxidase/carboxymuconolactone decarboxylase family protein YurZ
MAESTTETPVLDLLANMTADSMAASSLDPETLMLVRIAALVAVDAPSFSYLMNLEVASELDIDPERIRGVLAAVAPIVGTPRVASATGKIVEALAVEIEIAEFEEEEGEEAEEPTDEYEEEEEEEADEPTDEYEEEEGEEADEPTDEYEEEEGEEADEPTDEYEEEDGEEAEEPTDEYEEEDGEEAEEPTDEFDEQESSRDEEPEEPVTRSPRRRRSASPAGRRRG